MHIYIYTHDSCGGSSQKNKKQYAYLCTRVYIYIYTQVNIYIYTHVNIYIYIHIYTHIYIYLHIYIYIYIYMCIYIYLHRCVQTIGFVKLDNPHTRSQHALHLEVQFGRYSGFEPCDPERCPGSLQLAATVASNSARHVFKGKEYWKHLLYGLH